MNIEEAQKRKAEMEKCISHILKDFEEETGLCVVRLDMARSLSLGAERAELTRIETEVQL